MSLEAANSSLLNYFARKASLKANGFCHPFFRIHYNRLFASTIPALADSVYKVNCEAVGDSILLSSTGEPILEQRLARFTPLEPDGRNTTGKRGGQRAICLIKSEPLGYQWLSCVKRNGGYVIFPR